ncbi:MAG: zinc-dependent metalloprotease [Saprospiraceae bacterium]|nr:zinc-dependent metalloprotease [Saprospiraceae bacterium]
MKFFSYTLLICILLSCSTAFAQHSPLKNERCGFVQAVNNMEAKHPGYINAMNATLRNLVNDAALRNQNDTIYEIPVVIHIVYSNSDENLHDSLIQNQIAILNEDFGKMNSDISQLRPIFDDVVGNPKIQFRLDSIIRVSTTAEFSLFDLFTSTLDSKLKSTSGGGSTAVDPIHHLNIWVCKLGGIPPLVPDDSLLGFSYPPIGIDQIFPNMWPTDGLNTEIAYDGVVIHYKAFGKNNPYPIVLNGNTIAIKGRTTVHEVGHFLGLRHIWGDGVNPETGTGDGCAVDDFIADTPNAFDSNATTGCNPNTNSCETTLPNDKPDMWENYMDYSDEPCQVAFTNGQANVMRTVLSGGPRWALASRSVVSGTTSPNVDQSSLFSLYPNPSNESVYISLPSGKWQLTVTDYMGRNVSTQNSVEQNTTMQVSHLQEGIYFVNASNTNGQSISKKLIVRK